MDLVSAVWTLAKEIGKGGGGSTEEPTVCMSLLPVALGLLVLGLRWLKMRVRLEGGRSRWASFGGLVRKVRTT